MRFKVNDMISYFLTSNESSTNFSLFQLSQCSLTPEEYESNLTFYPTILSSNNHVHPEHQVPQASLRQLRPLWRSPASFSLWQSLVLLPLARPHLASILLGPCGVVLLKNSMVTSECSLLWIATWVLGLFEAEGLLSLLVINILALAFLFDWLLIDRLVI